MTLDTTQGIRLGGNYSVLWEPGAKALNPGKKFFVEEEVAELNLQQGVPE